MILFFVDGHTRENMILLHLITDDINLEHLVKVLPVELLHCTVSFVN